MENKINISLKRVIKECSLNKNLFFDYYYDIALRNRENIHKLFKYKKFNDDFVNSISICLNDDGTIRIINPNYDYFLERLLKLLNIESDFEVTDNDDLTKIMLNRVDILKNIQTESELKKEFPLLYRDLIDGRKYYNDLQKIKKINHDGYKDGEHYYYSCAMKKKCSNFVKTQSEMYKRYVLGRKKLKESYDNTNYYEYFNKNFDMSRLHMYIAYKMLLICNSSNDKDEILYFLDMINKYLNNNEINKKVEIIGIDNIKVDINIIKNMYQEIKNKYYKPINIVDWILVPKKNISKCKKDKKTIPRKALMNIEEIERLRRIGEDKTKFYESTDYIAKIIGLRKYKGYIGYLYKNGEIILDTQYDVNKPKTASGNAIYNMSIYDFELLSKMDKYELKQNSKVKRIYHSGAWKERINKIINENITSKSIDDCNKFIKKLKRKIPKV